MPVTGPPDPPTEPPATDPPTSAPTQAPATSGLHITAAEVAKFITAAIGAAAIAVTQGLITGTAAKWVAVVLGVASALGVYVVPNALPQAVQARLRRLDAIEGPQSPPEGLTAPPTPEAS
jgi:hypothetical protein